jgi:antitoxin (DNA-binding transcriptional repressor) of toxin-antitoxin stability system
MVVPKGKLKGKMLEYFRRVEETGETLIVTDRGREVLEIKALKPKIQVSEVISRLREKASLSALPDEMELMTPAADWNQTDSEIWLEDAK